MHLFFSQVEHNSFKVLLFEFSYWLEFKHQLRVDGRIVAKVDLERGNAATALESGNTVHFDSGEALDSGGFDILSTK